MNQIRYCLFTEQNGFEPTYDRSVEARNDLKVIKQYMLDRAAIETAYGEQLKKLARTMALPKSE